MTDELKCAKCDGCGKVADTTDQEPWSAWMELPLQSAGAVLAGLVKPIPCPECGGSGQGVPEIVQLAIIRRFVKRVNARAEANIAKTHKLEGSHYAAMQSLLKEMEYAVIGEVSEES